MNINKKNFLLLASVSLIILYFWKLLFYNFATDDFFYIWISKFTSLKEFLNFFTFEHSIEAKYIFYRPLTTQAYYGVIQNLFGLNPLPFHVASLLLHVVNTILVYKLARPFFQKNNRIFPTLSAMFFGLNPSQTMAIGWASNFQELGATFFTILSIFFFYKNLKGGKFIFLLLSTLFFVLALLSKEVAMVIPAVLILMVIFFSSFKNLPKAIPFIIILLVYIYMHFVKYHFQQTESYTFFVNLQAVNTLRWHLWWAMGFPEPFINFIGPKFKILPQIWDSFFKEAITTFFLFAIFNLSIIYAVIVIIKKKVAGIFDKKLLFFALFYLLFLLPVIFLPQNKYAYHQTTALVGFSISLSLILSKLNETNFKYSKQAILVAILSFIMLSYISVDLTIKNNFVLLRTKFVDKVLSSFIKTYPVLPENSLVYIKNDPRYYSERVVEWGGSAKQAYYALRGDLAFKLYYGDDIRVYYEGVDNLPKDIDKSKLIEYTADLNLDN